MPKKMKPKEEIDSEEEISEEEEIEEKKPAKEGEKSDDEVELDMTMEPSSRLMLEMESLDENDQMRLVARKLLEEFESDPNLAQAYADRKVTLKSVIDFIMDEAKKQAVNNRAMIDDKTVHGWAIHFVQDGKVKEEKKPTIKKKVQIDEESLRRQAEAEFIESEKKRLEEERRKQEEAEARAKAKAEERERKKMEAFEAREKRKREESGQMSIFEFIEATEGGQA